MVPTIDRLRELFSYDPETGVLVCRVARSNSIAGSEVGSIASNGYMYVTVDYARMLVHRVIWAIHYGEYPEADVDHEDRNKRNNRIINLRDASRSQNNANSPAPSNNTSGIRGISWNARLGKWHAYISWHGERRHLGFFDNLNDASRARVDAEMELFGKFAYKSELEA